MTSQILTKFAISAGGSQEIRLYASGLESAMKAAKTIVLFLTQRLYISAIKPLLFVSIFFLDPEKEKQRRTPMKPNTVPYLII